MPAKVEITHPIMTKYEIQTRAGAVWDWHCGANSLDEAREAVRGLRGYARRIVDTRTRQVVK